jgi:hypothetical protein
MMPKRREWIRTVAVGIALAGAALPTTRAKDAAKSFPSFEPSQGPPTGWKGPVFKLSQDYPGKVPKGEALPWMKYDFRTQPREYLMALRAYAYEGNINRGRDAAGNTLDWAVLSNPVRRWYHMPWRTPGNNGREFVHGLTMEFPSRPGTLDPGQKNVANTYAVAMYSPVAAFTVGQVWNNPAGPPVQAAANFTEGALIAKLLFTTADPSDVPEAEGAYTWEANIYNDPGCTKVGCARSVRTVRLFQMDVAVKDSRSPQTAWVFGTFVYDRTAQGTSIWEKMVPLGLMWGNDPDLTAASPAGAAPKESIIFKVGGYEHLGCHGRLSGPLDNAASACMSCHMAAQYPATSPVPNTKNAKCDDASNAAFWRNLSGREAFAQPTSGEKATPLDYSMEMASSVQNYMLAQKPATFAPDGKTFSFKGESTVHHVVVRDH